ncbi:diguanylate cyclase [Xylophilus rhododendri]|uniref:Diguanylate cyclase n=1 Tax=Xylophilus rhododendri TaxID=2697032 RepID=A0A857JA63_9BURK|nr:diguanylate cyclase [Xylophilus rhododendri]QHJ00797.1 diguanylate cyclase [Xylophilus rhododendri]
MFTSPRRTFALLALVPMISIAALFGMVVLDGRHDVTQNMRHSNANLSNTVEENIRRTLDFYDRSMLGVREEVGKPEVMALPPDIRNRVVFDKAVAVNGVSNMTVADASGQVTMSSNPKLAASNISIADRAYFIHHRDNLDPGLTISEPLLSKLDNQAVIILTRRIDLPDHSFGGVIALSLKLHSLDELFNAVNLGDGGRITLLREDGVVLARFPSDKETAGSSLADSPVIRRFKAGENNFETFSSVDGVQRFYVLKRITRYPLIISVAQATDLAYSAWRQRTLSQGLIVLTLLVGCLALAWLFLRELETRQRTAHRLRNAERDLRTILDGLPSMVAYWDKHLLIRFANALYMKTLGGGTDETGSPVGGLIEGQRLIGTNAPYFERALRGQRQVFETPVVDEAGQRRWLLVSFVPDLEDGVVQGVFVQANDISDRKAAADLLFDEKERIRVTLASIGDAVVSTDGEGRVTYLNPAAEIMSGFDSAEAIGLDVARVMPLHDPGSDPTARNPVAMALREQRIVKPSASASLVNRRQLRFDIEDTAAPIHDREGRTIGAVMVLRDVTADRAMTLRLAHLAQYDALTGLPNRVLLYDRAYQAITRAAREKTALALMYLDLDGFKDINDSLGHDAGDAVLVQFAERMSATLRASDTLSRQGGDEFILLAPMLRDTQAAEIVAAKMLAIAAEPFHIDGHVLTVTASLGVAMFPADGDSFDLLSRRADAAMYSAKRAGKNRWRFYSDDVGRHTELRFAEHRQEP